MHVSALDVALPIGEQIEQVVTIADRTDASARTWTLALAFDRVLLVENDCCRLVGEPREFASARAALDALEPAQRTALGLDATRYAALAVVDELRGALATDMTKARALVERALHELPAAFAVKPAGEWAIKRPVLATSRDLVWFADHIFADFARAPEEALARLRQLAIHLGVIARDDSARRTAFEATTPSGDVIDLPVEIVHPIHRDVRVRTIALVSEDLRPDLVFLAGDRYAGRTVVIEPLTAAYHEVRFLGQRIAHLTRLEAPSHLVEPEVERLQAAVDELAAVAMSPPEVRDAWERTPTRLEQVALSYRGSNPVTDGQPPPRAVLWLDADTIAAVRGDNLVTISLATKQVLREYPINFATVQACDDAGRFVLVGAEPEDYGGYGIGCLDLATGEWLDTLPDHIAPVTCGYDEVGVTTLYEHRRAARSTTYPALCFARGNRSVLLSKRNDMIDGGGICSTATLLSEVAFEPLDAAAKRPTQMVLATGELVAATPDHSERLEQELQQRHAASAQPWPAAIARADRWRFLLPSLHVGDVASTFFRLGFAIDCAAFSPDGQRLLVDGDELLVIDVPGGAITWRG